MWETKRFWVRKFKRLIVTRTNHAGRTVTRTKCGWIKHKGNVAAANGEVYARTGGRGTGHRW